MSELQSIIDDARVRGFQEIADRLTELAELSLEHDEFPLQAASVKNFMTYCRSRQRYDRPLMTVTPCGELDATWIGRQGQRQVVRFFPDGSFWSAS